ncbi:MAG: AAA family ATPase [Nocardioides sp.]
MLLNGLPGVGKSTLARRLVADRPGALDLDIDALRALIGGPWEETAEVGRTRALELATAHLRDGYDVLVPQLVADPTEVTRFRDAADEAGARFVHVLLTGEQRLGGEPWQEEIDPATLADYRSRLARLAAVEDDLTEVAVTSPEETAAAVARALSE